MASLHHLDTGAGAPLVFLHGFCADHRVWEAIAPPLAKRFRVIAPDLPGCGRSALLADNDIAAMADAVVQLLDLLHLEKVVLFGHSMGGYVALELAARYPQRLRALGLLHTHPYARLSDEEPRLRARSIAFMERYGTALFVKQLIPTLFAPTYSDRVTIEKLSYRALRGPAAGIIACQRAMLHRADHRDTLRHLGKPVLQIHGAADGVIPPATTEAMSVLPADGTVHWLPRVGHSGMLEQPRTLVQQIRNWLDSLPESESPK